jgi:type IV secretory pathway VirB2 component (pilin)
MPTDDIPRKLLRLLLLLIASGELPELAVGGGWNRVFNLLTPRPALGAVALEADICGLAVAGLRAVGSAADWAVSIVPVLALGLVR